MAFGVDEMAGTVNGETVLLLRGGGEGANPAVLGGRGGCAGAVAWLGAEADGREECIIGGGGGKDPTSGTEDLGGKAEGGTAVEGSLREFL